MAATDTVARPGAHQEPSLRSGDTGRSDRYLGKLLLVFFIALYTLTGGGHGYSPDGEFAYFVARSLTLDPEHDYLKSMGFRSEGGGLSQWGFMVPVLAQPLVLLGEPLANLMPHKDYVDVDGHTYVLGEYRGRDTPSQAPTAGPDSDLARSLYVLKELTGGAASSLGVISFLALAAETPQGVVVAELTVTGAGGESMIFPIRAGVETAEWRVDKSGIQIKHEMPRIASIWPGNTSGRNYFVELPFGRTIEPREITVRYLLPEGHLYIRSLGLLNQDTGSFTHIPSENRFWSERENLELFRRLFYSPYNAIVTALGCVLLFAIVRLMGYGQLVALTATLLYGLATVAWPYSKYDFSEPTLVMLILTTLYLILRWGDERRDRLLVMAGLAALGAVGAKYASGVLVPVMLLQIVLLHWERYPSLKSWRGLVRPVLLFCAPFLVVAAPGVWYMSRKFGYYPSILEAWAGVQRGWLPLPFSIGIRGLLFSPGKSFFLYSPPTILALFSAIPFVRRHGLRSVGLLLTILIYFTIYSKKVAWHAGAGWGPRYQVLVIPLVILIAAPLIQKAIEQRHRWSRYALIATFVLGLGLQVLAVSKSFDYYLGVFRSQIVEQMPDKGAQYGGGDYYPYAAGLDDGNSITATLWALPFSPILAGGWLLTGDILSLGPGFVQPIKEKLLGMPPWKLWGIDIQPAHPEYGLGLDFWSMRLRTDFPSYPGFLVAVALVVLALEAAILISGSRLVSLLFATSSRRATAIRAWVIMTAFALIAFDGIHLLL